MLHTYVLEYILLRALVEGMDPPKLIAQIKMFVAQCQVTERIELINEDILCLQCINTIFMIIFSN